ncbi:eukaryotic aspartyl protease [Necator americanus]|uniref:Eukaryotic aspartyl protease n=1 Tax=Necator americanus TaxID=51031 RepID=W2TD30_NECAM|nr:eukaryotic aspartyl protease [Necator americanus]ETN79504.1 eukaryotic aspartyl protease [Necator americanus]
MKVEFDGVLGLAYTANNGSRIKPFIVWAINQAALREPLFTVWLSHPTFDSGKYDGIITYGSVDTKNCGEVIGYANFSSELFYQYRVDAISMGQFKSSGELEVMQEFNGWITGPPSMVKEMAKIAGAQFDTQHSVYKIDCNARFPDLEIEIGSDTYSIKPKNLIVKVTNDLCFFMMTHGEPNSTKWYFGAPFIREYCTIFDIGGKRFGFAKANPNMSEHTTTLSFRRTSRKL